MNDKIELLSSIETINEMANSQMRMSLSPRKLRELEFHDQHRDSAIEKKLNPDVYEKLYGNKKYYITTTDSQKYLDSWIERHSKRKVFLDYACGNGNTAIKAARYGAKLSVGIDISSISILNARELAKKAGVEKNTRFVQADVENTGLPAGSIDTVLCSGMLHHVDLSYALPELRRILAPGGKMLALESLNYNPAITLYRHMTPQMRTEWEKSHILSLKDLNFAKRFFDLGEIRYWHILGIASTHVPFLRNYLAFADRILTRVPLVKLLSWMFSFELIRRT